MMNFGEKAAAKRQARDLKNELKHYKKSLCEAGTDKNTVGRYLKELQETVEGARALRQEYHSAREHFERAHRKMERILDYMEDWTTDEIIKNIKNLVRELHLASHECMMREDDMDFISSRDCLERMTISGELSAPGALIMLRSELENLYAIFSDAFAWKAPEFFPYAYYLLHEDGSTLKEMGNDQRIPFVCAYYEERFGAAFEAACERAGIGQEVRQMTENYIKGD